tara:strand:+ start:115 stop:1101 length:987 start_codon:yes stop_codon:yes gene_type:complete
MANNKYNLSKEYQFDIDVQDNTYAGKLALPYVTAAVKSPDTVAKGYVRTIDGLNAKAVISNLGISDPIVSAACSFSSSNDTSLTEQVLTLTDYKVNEEICRGTIFPTWIGENMDRNGNLPGTFEDFLLSTVAGKAGEQLEKGIWMGKVDNSNNSVGFTSNNGGNDAAGFAASACKDFTTVTFGDALAVGDILDDMASVFNAAVGIGGLTSKPGFGFYMNSKTYALVIQALAKAGSNQGINNAGVSQDFSNITYFGYPIYVCPGMFDNNIVATYRENLVFGTNLATDWTEARIIPTYQYDGSDNVRIVMNFAIGVQTAVATDGVYGSLL